MNAKTPDRHALNVADAVQDAVAPATVILFGSRAENRHREHSDIDLLIITGNGNPQGAEIVARKAASAYMKSNPPRHGVDVISMTRKEFDRCRTANQHVAGQAARYGIVMNGENLGHSSRQEDAYPDHWVETSNASKTSTNTFTNSTRWLMKTTGARSYWASAPNKPRETL